MAFLGGQIMAGEKPAEYSEGLNRADDYLSYRQKKQEMANQAEVNYMDYFSKLANTKVNRIDVPGWNNRLNELGKVINSAISSPEGMSNPIVQHKINSELFKFVSDPGVQAARTNAESLNAYEVKRAEEAGKTTYEYPFIQGDTEYGQYNNDGGAFGRAAAGKNAQINVGALQTMPIVSWQEKFDNALFDKLKASGYTELQPGDKNEQGEIMNYITKDGQSITADRVYQAMGLDGAGKATNVPDILKSLGPEYNSFAHQAIEDAVNQGKFKDRGYTEDQAILDKYARYGNESAARLAFSMTRKDVHNVPGSNAKTKEDKTNPTASTKSLNLGAINKDKATKYATKTDPGFLDALQADDGGKGYLNSERGGAFIAKSDSNDWVQDDKQEALAMYKNAAKSIGKNFDSLFNVVDSSDGKTFKIVAKNKASKDVAYTIAKANLQMKAVAEGVTFDEVFNTNIIDSDNKVLADSKDLQWLAGRGLGETAVNKGKIKINKTLAENLLQQGDVFIPGYGHFTTGDVTELNKALSKISSDLTPDDDGNVDFDRTAIYRVGSNNPLSYTFDSADYVDSYAIKLGSNNVILGRAPSKWSPSEGDLNAPTNSVGIKHLGAMISSAAHAGNIAKEQRFRYGNMDFDAKLESSTDGVDTYSVKVKGDMGSPVTVKMQGASGAGVNAITIANALKPILPKINSKFKITPNAQ